MVRGRYHIVLSARRRSASSDSPQGFRARLTSAIVGIGFLVVAVSVLVAALIFGSILAVILCVCLILVIAVVILKSTWQKLKRDQD
jgi:hypothetical protein